MLSLFLDISSFFTKILEDDKEDLIKMISEKEQ